jgi:hypothetical protein
VPVDTGRISLDGSEPLAADAPDRYTVGGVLTRQAMPAALQFLLTSAGDPCFPLEPHEAPAIRTVGASTAVHGRATVALHSNLTQPLSLMRRRPMLAHRPIRELLQRIRGEFLEMPGLHLTVDQARRLWSLDLVTCRSLLDALVDAKFLTRRNGRYLRVTQEA